MKRGEGMKNRSLDQEESRSIRSSRRRSWCKHTFQPEQLSTQQQHARKDCVGTNPSMQRANTKVKVTVGDIEKKDKADIEALASHDGKDPT